MSVRVLNAAAVEARRASALWPNLDQRLIYALAATLVIGLVMLTSASMSLAESQFGSPFYFLQRQLLFLGMTLAAVWLVLQVPVHGWYQASGLLLLLAFLLLMLVLVPGVGREVNGATRWIPVGIFHLQVAEVAKFGVLFYLAAYMVRRGDRVRGSMQGFLIPIALLGLSGLLLLMQPDFGGALVLGVTGLALLFLAGVPLWRFAALVAGAGGLAWMLIVTSPYRIMRLTAFVDPWADPFNTGFQLTQSLIAIGRGEWFGVGLGASVQKLFYLPEAHTDFMFAVLAEETGLIGVLVIIALYSWIVWRVLAIGMAALRANHHFGGYVSLAVGFWLGLQSFINIGVTMGLLPTKGLTLPLMSYGGSSLLTTGIALAVVLRVDYERRMAAQGTVRRRAV